MTDALFDLGPTSGASGGGPVYAAYLSATQALREGGYLKPEHEGLVANLLKLGQIIDTERKGYAVAHATGQAHDIMKTLLALGGDGEEDPFLTLMRDLQSKMPGAPTTP